MLWIPVESVSLYRLNKICNSKLLKEKGITAIIDGNKGGSCGRIVFCREEEYYKEREENNSAY